MIYKVKGFFKISTKKENLSSTGGFAFVEVFCFLCVVEDESENEGVRFCLSVVVVFWLSKAGFPPFIPASVRIFLKFSSRTIRRLTIALEDGSLSATPVLRRVDNVWLNIWLSKPIALAIISSDIGFPLRTRDTPIFRIMHQH